MNIYVGNMSYDTTENDLTSAFGRYGEVTTANIIMDRSSGRSKGFGFVEMPNKEEGLAAIEGLNGTSLSGRTITVNEARPKEPRNDNRRGGGGGYNKRY